jgi:hypothetical protein
MAHVVKELYNDSQLILVGDNNQVGCLSRHQSGSSILNVGNGCCIFSSPSFVLKLVIISAVAACYWQVATFHSLLFTAIATSERNPTIPSDYVVVKLCVRP